jgi:hypothetical protein
LTIDAGGEAGEVERADPRVRRIVLLVVAFGSAAGLFLISVGESQLPALERWITADRALFVERMRTVAAAMSVAFAAPTLLTAAYCWRLASRIVRGDRFPPAGTRIIHDVRVLRGAPARRRARALRALAIVFALATLGFVSMLWRVVP